MTEITDRKDTRYRRGWVCYDADCPFCVDLARRFESVLHHRGFRIIPLQTPWVRQWLGLRVGEPFGEMKVLTIDGSTVGGADAAIYLARTIWWAWPLWFLGHIQIVRRALQHGYAWVAQQRSCANGVCPRPSTAMPTWIGWLPLAVLPALTTAIRPALPAWGFMWMLAYALYAGFKWLTWWPAPPVWCAAPVHFRRFP